MILSHSHKFVFIKGMKVAGTSVEMALAGICGPNDIVTPISPIDERERLRLGGRPQNYGTSRAAEADYLVRLRAAGPQEAGQVRQPELVFYHHMPLVEVIAKSGNALTGYRVVCIERSPYAKVISWANMRLTYGAYRAGGEMRADGEALKTYVDRALENGQIRDVRNIDRYRGVDGKLAARPMRYASLQADYDAFVQSLGLAAAAPLPHAKKGLMSDRLDPRDMLRPGQIARINELFAAEFEAFGYERI
ncbi:MAG TPA: hypothetical protein VII56_23010 [Rhizomicrobium sp.]